jgi:hypothetical protein
MATVSKCFPLCDTLDVRELIIQEHVGVKNKSQRLKIL